MQQAQINKMLQDNMMILDTALSAVSSAEKLVFGINEGKKYGYYDENDTASWRPKEELKCELLTKIQCLNGMMKLYSQRYPGKPIKFPDDLSKNEILEDLYSLRSEALKHKKISKYAKYFTDLINLIETYKCQKYNEEEILEGVEPNISTGPRTENEVFKVANKFVKVSEKCEEDNKRFEEESMKSGGAFSYKFHQDNNVKKKEQNDYFKWFYYH